MKRSRFAPGLRVAVALFAVNLIAHAAQAITFGQPDSDNRFPNVGAIVVTDGPGAPYIVASGVLIHPRVFLTAGHTTASGQALLEQGVPVFDISRINFGPDALNPLISVRGVANITYPGFAFPNPNGQTQDLGVVILEEPVDLPCATLAVEGLLDDLKAAGLLREEGVPETFLTVGYGNTLDFPPPNEELADGLRRFVFSDYRDLTKNWLFLNQNPATGNGGIADHDSGGPVFWVSPSDELILVAINSRTDAQRISLYEACRTDTASALDFIDLVIALVERGLF
jgi:hypothetical protein